MRPLNELPGPALPATEQVRRWIESPVELWEECAREYGPMVALDLGSVGAVVLISDPQCVKEIFQLSPEQFECHQFNEHYRYVMGDHSVLLQDGEGHRRQRRLLAPLLRQSSVPKVAVISEIMRNAMRGWPRNEAFNPRPSFHEASFQIMLLLLLGETESETSQTFVTGYRNTVVRQSGSWAPWRNFARLQPKMRELLVAEIRKRREDSGIPGILTAIVRANTPDGNPVSDVECEDHVFSMMVAGVDPTAITLTWALYWLCKEKLTQKTLQREVDALSAINDAVMQLPYLNAVFCETLRMYPVVTTPSGRKLTRDVQLAGHLFFAGTTLVPCPYLIHRRNDLYPQSESFKPERFLDRTYAPFEFFPFGGGARACLGETMAEIEFKAIIATLLRDFSVTSSGTSAVPQRHGTLLAPPDDFNINVQPRVTQ